MRVGDEKVIDEIVFLGRRRLPAAAAALLRPVIRERLGFDVAGVRKVTTTSCGAIKSSIARSWVFSTISLLRASP